LRAARRTQSLSSPVLLLFRKQQLRLKNILLPEKQDNLSFSLQFQLLDFVILPTQLGIDLLHFFQFFWI
jgi:hypothetical protein